MKQNQIAIYKTKDGKTEISVKMKDESVWLTQDSMAQLFSTTKQNISLHINNILKEEELDEKSTVKEFLMIAESNPKDKDVIKQVVISVLNRTKS